MQKTSVVSNKSANQVVLDRINKNYQKYEKKFKSKLNTNLGVNIENGLNLKINLNDKQLAIFGQSNTGKTHLIKSMLVNMTSKKMPDKLGFVIVDVKKMYNDFGNTAYTKFYTDEPSLDLLYDLNLIKLARQNSFYNYENKLKYFNTNQAEKLIKIKHLVIVLDELLASYSFLVDKFNIASDGYDESALVTKINNAFSKLTDNFRNSQMTLITASQRTVDKAYSRSLINNADYKIMFKAFFESDVEKFAGYNFGQNNIQNLNKAVINLPEFNYDIFDANDANFNNIDTAIAPFDEKGLDSIINAINKFK